MSEGGAGASWETAIAQPHGSAEGFLIQGNPDRCRECLGCVRYCPAGAIRVAAGHAEVVEERCVKCGACVAECGNRGHVVRDDLPTVRELLSTGRPVVALLATEFLAALHPLSMEDIENALESLGFYAVESTLLGEELIATEYERLHARGGMPVLLRSTCPVTVEWVRRYRPALVSALVPLVSPYIAQARLIRELYPSDVAIVYVSPCFARKDEIREQGVLDAVDVAIDFLELKRLLSEGSRRRGFAAECGVRRPEPLKQISLTDGFPRSTMKARDKTDTDVVTIRGLRELDDLLDAVEKGEAAPSVVDMLNCAGCIDGPAVSPGLSLFTKRNVIAAEQQNRSRTSVSSKELLGHLPHVDVVRSFRAMPVLEALPTAEEIEAELEEGGFSSREDSLDCGACGYVTCVEHAEAVWSGRSLWDLCFPRQRRRVRDAEERLAECATTDPKTGLANRRVFEARLAEEISRSRRYGSRLALLLIGLDEAPEPDGEAEPGMDGKTVQALGEILRSETRATDVSARYGPSCFALALPGIQKTAAFAVAEKIRSAVQDAEGDEGASGEDTTATVSVGVAALGSSTATQEELLSAAERALEQARESGGDQVRLAPG